MQNLATWYSRSAGIGMCLRILAFVKYSLAKSSGFDVIDRPTLCGDFFYAHFVMLLLYNCMATKGTRERTTVGISFSHFALVGDFLSTLCKQSDRIFHDITAQFVLRVSLSCTFTYSIFAGRLLSTFWSFIRSVTLALIFIFRASKVFISCCVGFFLQPRRHVLHFWLLMLVLQTSTSIQRCSCSTFNAIKWADCCDML